MSYCYKVSPFISIIFNSDNLMTVLLHKIHGMEYVPYNDTTGINPV